MNLFDTEHPTRVGPARHNENQFDYYSNSARNDVGVIRGVLNEWFSNYPPQEQKELKARFSKDFSSSFYELFLYTLFRKLGFSVEIHPVLPNSPKNPDFLIKRDDVELYVEAKVVRDKSSEQEAFERRVNQFYDDLSRLNSHGFLLHISSLSFLKQSQPNTKPAIRYIEAELLKTDPDVLIARLEKEGHDAIKEIHYRDDNIQIVVRPMPVKAAHRGEITRPIGMYPAESFWGGGEESIKASAEKKARRYGKLDKPFLVCLNSIDMMTSGKLDIWNAVWGSLAWSWSEDPNNRDEKWTRKPDGVFFNDGAARLKNLSGLLITKVTEYNIPNAEYWLFQHPFTENQFDFSKLGLDYNYVASDNTLTDVTGHNLGSILGISNDWLNVPEP